MAEEDERLKIYAFGMNDADTPYALIIDQHTGKVESECIVSPKLESEASIRKAMEVAQRFVAYLWLELLQAKTDGKVAGTS